MTVHARVRLGLMLGALAVLPGCATQGPLANLEAPGALTLGPQQDWYLLGVQLLRTREPAQAERAFNRSLAVEGAVAATYTGLGIATAQQGLLTRARTHLEQARALAPEDATVHNNLGVVLYDLGEYHAARQAFQAAFLLSSGASEAATLNLAKAEEAIARAEQPLAVDPAVDHRIERVGSSEYRLLELDGAAEDAGTGTPG